jgi:hypothetical protein
MVVHWFRVKGRRWRRAAVVNGIGAFTTGVVLIIVTITKFQKGAKIVIAAMPIIVCFFLLVHRHYERVGRALRIRGLTARQDASNTFLLLVKDLGPATLDAVAYLRTIRPGIVRPLYVGPAARYEATAAGWSGCAPRLGSLEQLPGAEDHLVRAVRAKVRELRRSEDDFLTVMIAEDLTSGSWWQFVRDRTALLLKGSLLFEPGVVVTDVPLLPGEPTDPEHAARPVEPERSVVLIPISAVHDATIRAVVYAKSLNPTAIQGLFLVSDPEEAAGVVEGWHDRLVDVPLVMLDAAFRDLTEPLLREIRQQTARGDTVVTVVLSELIPAHWWENLLHNQTALGLKRALLFEPGVVVTSVPFHLRSGAARP